MPNEELKNYIEYAIEMHLNTFVSNNLVHFDGHEVLVSNPIKSDNLNTGEESIYVVVYQDYVKCVLEVFKFNERFYSIMSTDNNKTLDYFIRSKKHELTFANQYFSLLPEQVKDKSMLNSSDVFKNNIKNNYIYSEIPFRKFNIKNAYSRNNGTSSNRSRYPRSLSLNISGVSQGDDKPWCWAATIATNVNYLKRERLTARDVVVKLFGYPKNEGAYTDEVRDVYDVYNVNNYLINGSLYRDDVRANIYNDCPMHITLRRYSGDGYRSHAVSLYGYSDYSGDRMTYSLWDPARGYVTVDVDSRGDFVYRTDNGTYLLDNALELR